jgi:hypothetical protein
MTQDTETKTRGRSPEVTEEGFDNVDNVDNVERKESEDVQDNTNALSKMSDLIRNMSSNDDIIEGAPNISLILHKLVKFTEERRATHAESQHYFARLNAFFFWPSIVLTTLTSAASFLATQYPGQSGTMNVGIGIMACISTLIVALSETYRYGSKAEQHGLAAESYENLRTKLFFKSVHLKTLKEPETSCEVQAFFTSIEDQITEISRQCKDLVPIQILRDYKEKRLKALSENLMRNIKTLIAQVKYKELVDRLGNGETITKSDMKSMRVIDKV